MIFESIAVGPEKILIIDDSLSDIMLMQKALAGLGEIYSAASGLQGLEQLTLLKPAIVLLDVEMPDINGLEVCQQIRDNPELSHTRVIFVTGHTDEHTEYLSFRTGADEYLSKPYSMHVCKLRVQNQISMYRLAQQVATHDSLLQSLPVAVSVWSTDWKNLYTNTEDNYLNAAFSDVLGETFQQYLQQQLDATPARQAIHFESEAGTVLKGVIEPIALGSASALLLTLFN